MVRVIPEKKENIRDEEKKLRMLISRSINAHRSSYVALLSRFNMQVVDKSDNIEIKDKIYLMLSKGNPRFNEALAEELGMSLKRFSSYDGQEDHFDEGLIKAGLNTLSGALTGGKTKRYVAGQEARKGSYDKLLEMKDKNAQAEQQAKKQKETQKVILIAGVTLLVITIVGVIIYKQHQKANTGTQTIKQ